MPVYIPVPFTSFSRIIVTLPTTAPPFVSTDRRNALIIGVTTGIAALVAVIAGMVVFLVRSWRAVTEEERATRTDDRNVTRLDDVVQSVDGSPDDESD
jgi:hypothetical protein